MPSIHQIAALAVCTLMSLSLAGCETIQTMGMERRETLSFHVEQAQEEQAEAKEQFRDALEAFSNLIGFHGGDLQTTYERLRDQYEASQRRAEQVADRIVKIESSGNNLFQEWEDELALYSSRSLRDASRRKMEETKDKYYDLLNAMRRAEAKMPPVLTIFHDQVLYLKHNLNASAVNALEDTVVELETDVDDLVADLEASIAEANAFIQSMQAAGKA